MTSGSSQGLFVIVAVVIFGIFVLISYILFRDNLKTGLTSIFKDSIDETVTRLDTPEKMKDTFFEKGMVDLIGAEYSRKELEDLTRLDINVQLDLDTPLNNTYKYYPKDMNIQSIKGIEQMTNLESVSFHGNSIKDPHYLNQLPNLKLINLNKNKSTINFKDFKDMPELSTMYVETNTLTGLEYINEYPKLSYLNISYNGLKNIDFLKDNQTIERLYLYYSHLDNIDAILEMPNLKFIDLQHSTIKKDIKIPEHITVLREKGGV